MVLPRCSRHGTDYRDKCRTCEAAIINLETTYPNPNDLYTKTIKEFPTLKKKIAKQKKEAKE